jgi:hypothetical protein
LANLSHDLRLRCRRGNWRGNVLECRRRCGRWRECWLGSRCWRGNLKSRELFADAVVYALTDRKDDSDREQRNLEGNAEEGDRNVCSAFGAGGRRRNVLAVLAVVLNEPTLVHAEREVG